MGVYPMLVDETCWLLAADFDKSTWREDVRAFVETARRFGLPIAVERSRSGNGAHVWFFFSAPVAAAIVLAERSGKLAEFEAQLHALRERHATKPAFFRRLRGAGLGAGR